MMDRKVRRDGALEWYWEGAVDFTCWGAREGGGGLEVRSISLRLRAGDGERERERERCCDIKLYKGSL